MTALMGGGKAVDVACHDLSKGFSTVSCDMRWLINSWSVDYLNGQRGELAAYSKILQELILDLISLSFLMSCLIG